jgi:saccharopine dehydrogenase-like NADP-dependent oxidoreductase
VTTHNTDRLRVIAVGGAGSMGRWAVRTVAKLQSASEITIADIDLDRAERFAAQVGEPARALRLDATDGDALRAAFADHDVVINTMGPFATFVRPIVEAAIDTNCHYLDINDDWQPTIAIFEYDEEARRRGLHVVTGLGGSPGTNNLSAVLAAERLDRVDDLHTGWKLSGARVVEEPEFPSPPASAAMEHWLHQCSEPIRAWVDGAPGEVDPVKRIEFKFPGLGVVDGYTMGHPEPITLPRKYPDLRCSLNLQSGPSWLFDYLRETAARYAAGEIDLNRGAELLGDPPRPEGNTERSNLPIEWALAVGEKDGKPHRVAVWPGKFHDAMMGGNTGVPLAIGVELLRRGALLDHGVHAPETAIDPYDFFDLLAPLTDDTLESWDQLVVIAEESD